MEEGEEGVWNAGWKESEGGREDWNRIIRLNVT